MNLQAELSAISVFRAVLDTPPLCALREFLRCAGDEAERLDRYAAFVHSLAEDRYSFSDFLVRTVCADENPCVLLTARGEALPPALAADLDAELAIFSELTRLTPEALFGAREGYLPRFDSTATDIAAVYRDRLAQIHRYGYGIFAQHGMFRMEGGEIVPVRSADAITLDRFVGYDAPRKKVLDNTLALLEGRPAANVLLYGDAGTGKSSTVKACANHFFDRGLRLIELRKDQLTSLPYVMSRVAGNPLKFILFVDDLSFTKNDDSFSMLKAALEGSASATAANAVIYATSNRRHIVKETFSDREGDDIHRGDTMQELLSLSDRFGLTVYFEKPNKAAYLEIVRSLASQAGLTLSQEELDRRAEAFALAKGSRSPRAAEQFVRSLR